MATSALVIFEYNGELTGCEFRSFGFHTPEMLVKRFGDDVDALREFLVKGAYAGGYRSAEAEETYLDGEDMRDEVPRHYVLLDLAEFSDAVFLLGADGSIHKVNGL